MCSRFGQEPSPDRAIGSSGQQRSRDGGSGIRASSSSSTSVRDRRRCQRSSDGKARVGQRPHRHVVQPRRCSQLAHERQPGRRPVPRRPPRGRRCGHWLPGRRLSPSLHTFPNHALHRVLLSTACSAKGIVSTSSSASKMTTCFDCMQHKREILQLRECVHLAAAHLPPCLTNAFPGWGWPTQGTRQAGSHQQEAGERGHQGSCGALSFMSPVRPESPLRIPEHVPRRPGPATQDTQAKVADLEQRLATSEKEKAEAIDERVKAIQRVRPSAFPQPPAASGSFRGGEPWACIRPSRSTATR